MPNIQVEKGMVLSSHSAPPIAHQKSTVLLCGASGFIGSVLANQLRQKGYQVQALSRQTVPAIQYAQMQTVQDWLPHLRNIDVVINAVGALRDQHGQQAAQLVQLHANAPKALFDACAIAGVRTVMQLSALGSDSSDAHYAKTKLAADQHLLALTQQGKLNGIVIRPSVVMGAGGGSTPLFLRLSKLPFLVLPQVMFDYQVQPVLVDELAEAMLRILESGEVGVFEMGGPDRLTMVQVIASLRQQAGQSKAYCARLPSWMSALMARAGDHISFSQWSTDASKLASRDNCCSPASMVSWLGRSPTAVSAMLPYLQKPRNN